MKIFGLSDAEKTKQNKANFKPNFVKIGKVNKISVFSVRLWRDLAFWQANSVKI